MATKSGKRRNADEYCKRLIEQNPNLLIPHYLIHSYLYYVHDKAIITDAYYDELCKELDRRWDTVVHFHKHLVDREALVAGTGFYLQFSYPERVKWAAAHLASQYGVTDIEPTE